MAKTHYDTLGVKPSAASDEIKKAYYGLRKQYADLRAPTTIQDDRLKRINVAWDCLKARDRKAEYDAELRRIAEAARQRVEAARRKAEDAERVRQEEAARASVPPQPQWEAEEIEEPTETWQYAPPPPPGARRQPLKSMFWSSMRKHWRFATGIACLYIVALIAQEHSTRPSTAPAEPVAAETKAPPARLGVRKRVRKKRGVSVAAKRKTRGSNQDAAEMNRRELERMKTNVPSTVPTPPKSPYRVAPDYVH